MRRMIRKNILTSNFFLQFLFGLWLGLKIGMVKTESFYFFRIFNNSLYLKSGNIPCDLSNSHKTDYEPKKIIIGIYANEQTMKTRGEAIYDTWFKTLDKRLTKAVFLHNFSNVNLSDKTRPNLVVN